MTRLVMALLAVSAVAGKPASYKVDDDYVAVRVDVLAEMKAAEDNLPACEKSLHGAQDDLQALRAEADRLRAAATELKAQKAALEAHIGVLEAAMGREASFADNLEAMDEELACAGCWALGTLQCVGLAWIFNQEAMR